MNNLHIQGLHIKWDDIDVHSYLREIPSISTIEQLQFHKPITFFVGENGSGKSTLLEAIAVASAEDEYSKGPGGQPMFLHEKSHGESFLAIAQENFKPNGVYVLDEPEAALSPQRQLTLLIEIYECAKEGSQFIIVTHSPILLGIPDAEIWSFDDGKINTIEYEETDSYQVTEMFINNKDQLLKKLIG